MLTRVQAADPDAVSALLTWRVAINDKLAADPTIQVYAAGEISDDPQLSSLGLINGLFGIAPCGWGHIMAVTGLPESPEQLAPPGDWVTFVAFERLDHSRCVEGDEHIWDD